MNFPSLDYLAKKIWNEWASCLRNQLEEIIVGKQVWIFMFCQVLLLTGAKKQPHTVMNRITEILETSEYQVNNKAHNIKFFAKILNNS